MNSVLTASNRYAFAWLKIFAVVCAGIVALTVSAKIQVPSWPVPMTLQTLAVLAMILVVGPRLAMVTFASYLAVGLLGWPVFAGGPERGVGMAYLLGPTGGYLVGMLAASWLAGVLAPRFGRVWAMWVGLSTIYAFGLVGLSRYVPVEQLLQLGFFPFALGDIATAALLTLIPLPNFTSAGSFKRR